MFIVNLTYKKPIEDVENHLEAHRAYLKDQYAAGHFIASGRKEPRTGGIIMARMKELKALQAELAKDPFNKEGIADYEIIEFIPSMTAEGYENLE